jgi:hypothetical protein
MKISTAHRLFSEYLEKPDALENPQDYLGPNYLAVLNFWLWIDTLSTDQWKEVARRYDAIPSAARDASGDAAWSAARYAASDAAWNAAGVAAEDAARVAARVAAGWATVEIMGSHNLIEKGTPLTFVPLFEFSQKKETNSTSYTCTINGIDFPVIEPKVILVSTPNGRDPFNSWRTYSNSCCEIEL